MVKNGRLINPEVRIEITNRCNAHCVICPREKMTRKLCNINDDLCVSVIHDAKELGAELISLFGFGEPLLHRNVDKFVGWTKYLGMNCFITTNGSLLTRGMASELLGIGLDDIRVSFHGTTKLAYERIHCGLNFDNTMKNIDDFLKLRSKRGYKTRLHIVSIPVKDETVAEIKKFWEGRCDFLEIWKPHNWTTGRKYRRLTLERKTRCHRPFSGPVQVQADGTLVPCCFITNNEYVCGNCEVSLHSGLTSPVYERFRELHRKENISGIVCSDCDQLNIEEESPLLYSSRNMEGKLDRTYGTQFQLAS